jgi:hypothetical protein
MTRRQQLALYRAMRVARWIVRNTTSGRGNLTRTAGFLQLVRAIERISCYRKTRVSWRSPGGLVNAGLNHQARQAMLALAKLDASVRLAKRSDEFALRQWKLMRRFEVPDRQIRDEEQRPWQHACEDLRAMAIVAPRSRR